MMTVEGRNGSTDAVNDRDEQVGVAGRMGSGNRGAGPQLVFGPHIEADGITMSFRRMLKWDGETVGESCLWRHRMESSDELERVFVWMINHERMWTYWGRYGATFGFDDVFAAIMNGLAEEEEVRVWEERNAREAAERARHLSTVFESFPLDLREGFGVAIRRGAEVEPLWTVLFREEWERERFQDWFRWQHDRLADWAAYLSTHSPLELERILLREMLQTERSARKAGTAAGGRRPLRFYRGDL